MQNANVRQNPAKEKPALDGSEASSKVFR